MHLSCLATSARAFIKAGQALLKSDIVRRPLLAR